MKPLSAGILIGALLTLGHCGEALPQSANPGGTEHRPTRARLFLLPIKDAGGANTVNPKESPLTERLGSAVRKYLEPRLRGECSLFEAKSRPNSSQPGVSLSFEMEISRVQSGDPSQNPYLFTSRLYLLTKPAKLIGQWSGTAKTLRYLTANLSHSTGVSEYGLVGELGNLVIHNLKTLECKEPEAEFGMLKRDLDSKDLTLAFIGNSDSRDMGVVKLSSSVSGSLSLLLQEQDGALTDLSGLIPSPSTSVEAGIESVFTLSLPLKSDRENINSCRLIALVRRASIQEKSSTVVETGNSKYSEPPSGSDSPVQILTSGNPVDPSSETSVSRILRAIRFSPPGSWSLQSIKL